MSFEVEDEMLTLNPDQSSVRLVLPSLPLDGSQQPLAVVVDFDVEAVDAILERLTALRAQMRPQRHAERPN